MSGGGPREIGPYRLADRLGAGGMGEVWRAWDERLERSVAVKLIRPESCQDQTARERFRREARAAAALSHPAIVQIHDIVTSAEEEAIVMELVEGELLARRIQAGPLDVGEAVRLGREIAEGLAAAHARGLLHRDLKAENVMIDAEGHAKILDFGLARRLEGETSLTHSGAVIGTFRSMSPEQARGLPLDARSDLFSFGVLLYEMLTGRSPFLGPSAPDTIARVCTTRQAPARGVRPELPSGLSALIDRLLEKDPALRPASAREVAAALASVMEGAGAAEVPGTEESTWTYGAKPFKDAVDKAVSTRPARLRAWRWIVAVGVLAVLAIGLAVVLLRRPPQVLHVAVLRPEVAAGSDLAGVDLLALGLRTALLRGLLSLEGIAPLAPEQVDAASGPPVQVARAMAADEVVTSRMECRGETCEIALSRIRPDGALAWTQSFSAPIDKPYLLAEAVEGYLKDGFAGRRIRAEISKLEVRPDDYAKYLRLLEERQSRKAGLSDADILARLDDIHASSPRFLEAYVFEADILRLRFLDRRDRADLDRAFRALARARELAPSDPRPWVAEFELGLHGERLDLAQEAVSRLERLQPGDPRILALRARLLERQGASDQALALMRKAVRRFPAISHLSRLADMEYRFGETDAARSHLEEILRRSPGYPFAQSLLAQIELQFGSPRRAAELYSELVRNSPGVTELINLGTAQMLLGRYTKAEATLRRAMTLEPNNPFVGLNLADVCLLRGKKQEAEDLYRRLLKMVEQDPAASNWQLISVRAQALAHLGKRREAAAAAQQVLRLAQGNAQAALEVSQIYALVGDLSSAFASGEEALRRGIDPRWFTFPWFDSLRALPEFGDLLAQRSGR